MINQRVLFGEIIPAKSRRKAGGILNRNNNPQGSMPSIAVPAKGKAYTVYTEQDCLDFLNQAKAEGREPAEGTLYNIAGSAKWFSIDTGVPVNPGYRAW
jgi:hypothetical protein